MLTTKMTTNFLNFWIRIFEPTSCRFSNFLKFENNKTKLVNFKLVKALTNLIKSVEKTYIPKNQISSIFSDFGIWIFEYEPSVFESSGIRIQQVTTTLCHTGLINWFKLGRIFGFRNSDFQTLHKQSVRD